MADAHRKPLDRSRPIGSLTPESERLRRALRALTEERLGDVQSHIEAMPDTQPLEKAWKHLVTGLLGIERRDHAAAERALLQSIPLALQAGLGDGAAVERDALRLAAWGFEKLGWIYRRQDRPDRALRAHHAAYSLRDEQGSYAELWESATSLGLDADVASRFAVGQAWHHRAIEFAARLADNSDRCRAIAWSYLARSLTDSDRHEDAVEAATRARAAFRKDDAGAVEAAVADMKLGHALLRYGESLHDAEPARAKPVLADAIRCFDVARESLLAFGPNHADDAHWCSEQRDFAARLTASLDLPPRAAPE